MADFDGVASGTDTGRAPPEVESETEAETRTDAAADPEPTIDPASADVCVLIPTRNEAETVGDVVEGFRERGYRNLLVVDGHSEDGTAEIAREAGARIVQQTGTGKGAAVRQGIREIDAEYVLMLDGDATYDPADADRMLEPLLADEAEHVVGDRFADMREGAMPGLNRHGNRLINRLFATIHGQDFGDLTSGYRAFTRESFDRMNLTAEGFGIETEMAVECARHRLSVRVVPITYRPRPAGSNTNLNPVRDGGVILATLYRMAKTSNPLFYFGSVGVLFSIFGGLLGTYVGVEWVTRRVGHEVLAVVAAFAILLGIQLLMFGLLSDMIVTLHEEQVRLLDERDD
jgi:dolichol-phosphate mannosyltransferase